MRHRKAGVHLSRTSAHRKALFSNLVAALLTNERIRTTDAKAKETRRLAERTITWARRVGEVLSKKPDRRTTEESARVVHAVRMARRVVRDPSRAEDVTQEVFLEIWRKAARFDSALGKAKTWVMTIAHRRSVDAVRESWLVEDRWWTDAPLRRRYWEVVTTCGRDVVVYRDLVGDGWFTHR